MIELENGVKLGDEFMEHGNQDFELAARITRNEAAAVFKTGSESIQARCACRYCVRTGYESNWPVSQEDDYIHIGCCTFTPEMIAIVRKWAGVE